jgi:hypothetical protein
VTVRHVTRQALHILSFAVTLAVVVGLLKVLNWVPGALEPGLMARYPSIEAAASRLGIRQINVPAYFPESLRWPPAGILAQSKPYQAVVMEFARAGDGQIVLVISQAASPNFEPDVAIRFDTISETIPLDLGGRKARLEAGACGDRSACSRIQWDEGKVRIVLTMKAPAVELVRIAQSMQH